ncbi:MAG: hypothetical protein QOI61_547, partial [Actinomycetota bacterium]
MRTTSRTRLTLLLALIPAASLASPARAAAPDYVPSGRLARQLAPTHMAGKVNPASAEA